MYPKIFGIFDSYTVMEVLGIIAAFILAVIYLKRKKFTKDDYIDLSICGLAAVFFGMVFALLLQNLYDWIYQLSISGSFTFQFRMTFYGGLIGGVIGFLFVFYTFIRKKSSMRIGEVLKIAPACVTLAHAFGRIGCFLAGCCHGKISSSGLYFPDLGMKVVPTQLYEAIFLFLLTIGLIILAFIDFKYSFVIYLLSYSVFRFIIEFFRGDDRGFELLNLSPSQIVSILIILASFPLMFLAKKYIYKKGYQDD